MLWKELHTGGTRGFARLVSFLLLLIGGGFLTYYSIWLGGLAISERWDHANFPRYDYRAWANRYAFQAFLYWVVPSLYVLGILGVAGSAAASMTSEHEEDTWVSLTATDLTSREIVFAKIIGALRRGRIFIGLIILLTITGIVASPTSALSIPLLLVAMAVYGWTAAALGVWISLQLRSTWRAQFLTMACLLLINVLGQGILNMLARYGFAPQIWPGFTPHEISKLILDTQFIEHLSVAHWPRSWWVADMDNGPAWQAIFSVVSLSAYAALATLLTWHTLRRFETVAGRARRSTTPTPTDAKEQIAVPTSNQHQVVDANA